MSTAAVVAPLPKYAPTHAPKPICIFTSPSPTPRIASIGNSRTKPRSVPTNAMPIPPVPASISHAAVVQQAEHPAAEDQRAA